MDGNLLRWCWCAALLIFKLWFWSSLAPIPSFFSCFCIVPDSVGFFFLMPYFNFYLGFNYYSDFRLGSWWIFSSSCPPGCHPRGETGKRQQKKGEMTRVIASRIGCRRLSDQSLPAEIRPVWGRTIVLLFSSGVINKKMRLSKRKKGFFLYFSFLSVFWLPFPSLLFLLSCRQSYLEKKCCFHEFNFLT